MSVMTRGDPEASSSLAQMSPFRRRWWRNGGRRGARGWDREHPSSPSCSRSLRSGFDDIAADNFEVDLQDAFELLTDRPGPWYDHTGHGQLVRGQRGPEGADGPHVPPTLALGVERVHLESHDGTLDLLGDRRRRVDAEHHGLSENQVADGDDLGQGTAHEDDATHLGLSQEIKTFASADFAAPHSSTVKPLTLL